MSPADPFGLDANAGPVIESTRITASALSTTFLVTRSPFRGAPNGFRTASIDPLGYGRGQGGDCGWQVPASRWTARTSGSGGLRLPGCPLGLAMATGGPWPATDRTSG